jgi:hypothetical protein
VILVIKPQGGPDDWRALFHEAGHTEHFAHTSSSLTVEERRLGDNAVTEGWAMLLEHLTIDAVWLTRMLDFPRPEEYAAEGATQLPEPDEEVRDDQRDRHEWERLRRDVVAEREQLPPS